MPFTCISGKRGPLRGTSSAQTLKAEWPHETQKHTGISGYGAPAGGLFILISREIAKRGHRALAFEIAFPERKEETSSEA